MKELFELKQEALSLGKLVAQLGASLDFEKLSNRASSLEEKQNEEGFWDDQKAALGVVNELNDIKGKLSSYQKIKNDYDDLTQLLEDPDSASDEMKELLDAQEKDLAKEIKNLRNTLLFAGKYDNLDVTLEIHPGAGGTEANDWAEMLLRMYSRWAEKHHFKWQVLDYEAGDEAGLKSATVKVSGHNIYGYLKSEKGIHRLVRISPFDANARRHTSFASVLVTPEFGDVAEIEIDPKDLRVDTYRSGGAGGQNVNKVSSAVRITHLPTGIVVSCQVERSQLFNKQTCMEMLKSKLMERKVREQEALVKSEQGEQKNIEWGSQIRSYVFCPYTLVKDNRTSYETPDVNGVMDGDLDGFIFAYLEQLSRNGR